ncbi:MAG: hypothetical protein MJ033_06135 [Victivallaceae bacterium]|nr:hypothetical protein [Victivallaceae bacterium]
MANENTFVITTLNDRIDQGNGIISLRDAFNCALFYAGEMPENDQPLFITFADALFAGNEAEIVLHSALDFPENAFVSHPLFLLTPAGKSVKIVAPQQSVPWQVAEGSCVTFETLSVQPVLNAMPLLASAPETVTHLFVDPDYTEEDATHFLTIANAVAAYPDFTGKITVEKSGATTEIGALTTPAKIFGGAAVFLAGGTHSDDSALSVDVAGGTSADFRLLVGGKYVEVSGGTTTKIGGNSFLEIGGKGTIDVDFAFGGFYLASGTVSATGNAELSISDGTFHSVVCGGHIVGGTATLLKAASGSCCTLTISGGVFLKEVAAGSYNQAGRIEGRHVTNTLTITGGTFCQSVYGGNLAAKQELARSVNEASPIDMIVNSHDYVTVDTSENTVALLKHLVLGSRYQGNIQGGCSVTFSGIAENLFFGSGSFVVGDSESASDDEHRINGARSLVFDAYRSSSEGAGAFAPLDLFAFDRITFAGNSNVDFCGKGRKGEGFDLTAVKYWNFEYGSSLEWMTGSNDFYADALQITLNGATVESPWTILTGSDDTLYRWDKLGLNANYPVSIDGVKAVWDKANQWFATSEYKIYREDNSLKLAALA